jgi:hypothetical protein
MLAQGLIGLVVALKFVVPVLLPRIPFAAGWTNFILDALDGDLLVPLGLVKPAYEVVDKAADWVTYVFMVAAAWRGRWPIRRWLAALFVLRSVGQLLFFATGDERVFLLFPNFLEPIFLVYASALFLKQAEGHAWYLRHRAAIWALVVLYKLPDEWIVHIARIDMSDLLWRLLRR